METHTEIFIKTNNKSNPYKHIGCALHQETDKHYVDTSALNAATGGLGLSSETTWVGL